MKIMSKSISALLLAAFSLVVFTGCEKDNSDAETSTIVDVLNTNGYTTLTNLAVTANLGGTLT
ncbi:MAG: hypothetical protein MUE71_05820, partial [Chitinophagaceae bacterium]|nr:hypothetical protein [Chitinophagaceae bacterium]